MRCGVFFCGGAPIATRFRLFAAPTYASPEKSSETFLVLNMQIAISSRVQFILSAISFLWGIGICSNIV